MESTIGVLLVCPKTLVTELLVAAFESNPRTEVKAHATTAEEILAALSTEVIDVALIDGHETASAIDTIQVLRIIRDNAPNVRPVMLLDKRDPDYIVECFRNGARGVFSKNTSAFKLLIKCVECVHKGQIWASTEELEWMLRELESSQKQSAPLRVQNSKGVNLLSKREEDVVRHLMEGLSNREIAQNLSLSEHTVKNYLFRIFDKLGVSSRTELLLYAMSFRKNGGVARDDSAVSVLAS